MRTPATEFPTPDGQLQADLAERDFTAEKGEIIVISTGAAVDAKAEAKSELERRAAEDRNRHMWVELLMHALQIHLPSLDLLAVEAILCHKAY